MKSQNILHSDFHVKLPINVCWMTNLIFLHSDIQKENLNFFSNARYSGTDCLHISKMKDVHLWVLSNTIYIRSKQKLLMSIIVYKRQKTYQNETRDQRWCSCKCHIELWGKCVEEHCCWKKKKIKNLYAELMWSFFFFF